MLLRLMFLRVISFFLYVFHNICLNNFLVSYLRIQTIDIPIFLSVIEAAEVNATYGEKNYYPKRSSTIKVVPKHR